MVREREIEREGEQRGTTRPRHNHKTNEHLNYPFAYFLGK